jgi:hypothetical protein
LTYVCARPFSFLLKTGWIANSPAKSLHWKCRCFMESDETEIAIDLFIQICELRWARYRPRSRLSLAHFRNTEQGPAAKLARVGQVSVQEARQDSTARP